jgi:hypothetical protein
MKPEEQKQQFILLRAENKSYSKIASELHISKATCTSWEKELRDQISTVKAENLADLYNSYYMTKEARIKKLGSTLSKINTALELVDLKQIQPDKLLDFKLKYTQALKEEYIPVNRASTSLTDPEAQINPDTILKAYTELLRKVESGEISQAQADKENDILSNTLKAYETTVLADKIDALASITEGR